MSRNVFHVKDNYVLQCNQNVALAIKINAIFTLGVYCGTNTYRDNCAQCADPTGGLDIWRSKSGEAKCGGDCKWQHSDSRCITKGKFTIAWLNWQRIKMLHKMHVFVIGEAMPTLLL